jgi:hypothetical protein
VKIFANGIGNAQLAKLLSIETMIGAVIGIFGAGIIWANLNTGVAEAQNVATENKSLITSLYSDVGDLKTSTKVIEVQQREAKKQLEDLAEEVQKNREQATEDTKQILRALAERNQQ